MRQNILVHNPETQAGEKRLLVCKRKHFLNMQVAAFAKAGVDKLPARSQAAGVFTHHKRAYFGQIFPHRGKGAAAHYLASSILRNHKVAHMPIKMDQRAGQQKPFLGALQQKPMHGLYIVHVGFAHHKGIFHYFCSSNFLKTISTISASAMPGSDRMSWPSLL